jgi:hypothetical protein
LNTIAGQYSSSYKVPIKDIALPELDRHSKIDGAYAFVFDSRCHYHCILGSGFLTKAGIDIKFSEKQVEWFGNTIPLCCPNDFTPKDLAVCLNSMQLDVDDDLLADHFNEDIYDNYAGGKILNALYEKMDVAEVVKMQTHLTEQQQSFEVLSKYPKVFGNDLGCYPHKQFHIDLPPTPSLCIDEPILCHDYMRRPSRKSWSTWSVLACSLLKAVANGDCLHSSLPKKTAVFDGLVTFVN